MQTYPNQFLSYRIRSCLSVVFALAGFTGCQASKPEAITNVPQQAAQPKSLLSRGPAHYAPLGKYPNTPDINGITPLGVAAYKGEERQVAELLKQGANPNWIDETGKTPLQWAAYIGHPRVVKLLRENGAWIPKQGLRGPAQRDLDEAMVAFIHKSLINRGWQYSGILSTEAKNEVKAMIKRGADAKATVNLWNKYNPLNNDGKPIEKFGLHTPLLAAIGDVELTRLFLKLGAKPNVFDEAEGEWPITEASDAEVAKMLIEHGARLNVIDFRGETALMEHVESADVVRVLLDNGANMNQRDEFGRTAMMYCESYTEDSLKVFLAHGAKIDERDNEGRTALHNAAAEETGEGSLPSYNDKLAKLLLRYKSNPNARDSKGDTPLMLLAWRVPDVYSRDEQLRFARLLLAAGARRNLRNHRGLTALQIARYSGAKDIARLLRTYRK